MNPVVDIEAVLGGAGGSVIVAIGAGCCTSSGVVTTLHYEVAQGEGSVGDGYIAHSSDLWSPGPDLPSVLRGFRG